MGKFLDPSPGTSLSSDPHLDKEKTWCISEWVKLRNIISHEYLDLRWNSVKKFIEEAEPVYRTFLEKVKIYIKERL